MRIAVTGSTGLIGSALVTMLTNGGHEVVRMRRPAEWDPDAGTVNASVLNGVDAVVHLAGENIAAAAGQRLARPESATAVSREQS